MRSRLIENGQPGYLRAGWPRVSNLVAYFNFHGMFRRTIPCRFTAG